MSRSCAFGFPPCPQKFGTSYMTYRRAACSAAARNPREITISLASICREPSCIQKHNSPLRFVFQRHCTSICIQRGPLGPSAVPPADEVFIRVCTYKISLFDTSFRSFFPITAGAPAPSLPVPQPRLLG